MQKSRIKLNPLNPPEDVEKSLIWATHMGSGSRINGHGDCFIVDLILIFDLYTTNTAWGTLYWALKTENQWLHLNEWRYWTHRWFTSRSLMSCWGWRRKHWLLKWTSRRRNHWQTLHLIQSWKWDFLSFFWSAHKSRDSSGKCCCRDSWCSPLTSIVGQKSIKYCESQWWPIILEVKRCFNNAEDFIQERFCSINDGENTTVNTTVCLSRTIVTVFVHQCSSIL